MKTPCKQRTLMNVTGPPIMTHIRSHSLLERAQLIVINGATVYSIVNDQLSDQSKI